MRKNLILICILLLGCFLRFWNLSSVPNGLTWDEAAIGYNAFSILKTGRDEHGVLMPLIFKSFGDYKPGVYIYLTVPAVAIFGLNEFAVRFPSALFGVIGVFGVYLLLREILPKPNKRISLSAAFAVAVSPWLVHFSHGAWETNVFTTLLIFSIYFFIRFTNKTSSVFPTLFLACISLAMYQGAKLLVPLIYLFLIMLYWEKFSKNFLISLKSSRSLWMIPCFVFGVWIYLGALFGSAGNRLSTLSIFNYRPTITADNELFHNQFLLSTNLVLSRYLYHFSPEVLFYEGSRISERAHIPGLGLLHPLEFIFLVFGAIYLVKYLPTKTRKLIIGLLILSPIPASLTLAEFSPVRALFMGYPLAIISGLGIFYLSTKSKIFFSIIFLAYTTIALYVYDLYFIHSQTAFATEFNYGYREVVESIKRYEDKKVYFTDVYGQPYIYYLFYTQYDPSKYQKNNDYISGGLDVGRVGRVGRVQFQQFGRSEMSLEKDVLYIGTEGNIDKSFDIAGDNVEFFRQVETPDHKIIFRIVKLKP